MQALEYLVVYGGAAAAIVGIHLYRRRRKQAADRFTLEDTQRAGLDEPLSLHPVVNPDRCFGSGACVKACPEKALGIVDGKATLINASACVGHGACIAACPSQALHLVFGTSKRGVDIPAVTPEFESNVPGIFIAGELGGMGLIRKATAQGRQAVASIKQRIKAHPSNAPIDVVIIGAGPAGISAGLSAMHHGLSYKLLEQEASFGGTVYHYPRNKVTMTAPVQLDLVGSMNLGTLVRKESLLSFWQNVIARTGLKMQLSERLEKVERLPDGSFQVHTTRQQYHAKTVLLALGRRGTPRKLGVPGEDQAKVVYRLIDPEQYKGQRVLVVGGGDSAVEAAVSLAQMPGTTVHLSYRGEAFSRVKQKNRQNMEGLSRARQLHLVLQSNVKHIGVDDVTLDTPGGDVQLPNDVVIVCAGGVLPTGLLQSMGVLFETKFGTA